MTKDFKYQQVAFKDEEGYILGGILMENGFILCGECGGLIEADEVEWYPLPWIDISDAIKDGVDWDFLVNGDYVKEG